MNKILVALVSISLFARCSGNHSTQAFNSKPPETMSDSLKKRKFIDSQMALGDRPDSEQEGPSFKEVLADQLASYNKVENIDKSVIDGKDTLKLHETHYCLHDSSLSIPKKYMWGGNKTKDFVTNNFASKIVLIVNKDTVLNKVFNKRDFNNVIYDQLKKYAIVFNPGYIGYNKTKGELALGYSISIPLTDVGVPAYITIDKKGKITILNEYAKMDSYKKN
jgi:hypothetical protein